jgi:hypothetical protein
MTKHKRKHSAELAPSASGERTSAVLTQTAIDPPCAGTSSPQKSAATKKAKTSSDDASKKSAPTSTTVDDVPTVASSPTTSSYENELYQHLNKPPLDWPRSTYASEGGLSPTATALNANDSTTKVDEVPLFAWRNAGSAPLVIDAQRYVLPQTAASSAKGKDTAASLQTDDGCENTGLASGAHGQASATRSAQPNSQYEKKPRIMLNRLSLTLEGFSQKIPSLAGR